MALCSGRGCGGTPATSRQTPATQEGGWIVGHVTCGGFCEDSYSKG